MKVLEENVEQSLSAQEAALDSANSSAPADMQGQFEVSQTK